MADSASDKDHPPGLQLLHTLYGHEDTIVRVTWMPDGYHLLSASIDNTVRLWNLEQGVEVHHLQGQGRGFTDVAVTPSGTFILTTSWNDPRIEVWQLETGHRYWALAGHQEAVNSLCISPDGRYAISASDDASLRTWSLETGKACLTLHGHELFVWSSTTTRDSQYVISAASDRNIKIWDINTGEDIGTLYGHTAWVMAVVVTPDGNRLVSASDDHTIRVWDLASGHTTSVLTGHSSAVNCLDISADGRLLASKSMDGTVRLWRTDTWEPVAVLREPVFRGRGHYPRGIAFHPTRPLLASLGEKDTAIRIWKLDYSVLLANRSPVGSYTTAKIALIGDPGVGKSGLGYRLANNNARDSYATAHQHTWVLNDLSITRDDGAICNAVLWDFVGKPNSYLVQSLFLRQADIVLLMFDPTHWEDPFGSLEYWIKHFNNGHRKNTRLVLVGARTDQGIPTLSDQDFMEFCQLHHIEGGYVATSAVSGKGIDDLMSILYQQLDWNNNTATVNLGLFNRIKGYIEQLKSATTQQRVTLSLASLKTYLHSDQDGETFDDDEIIQALHHLENHGYIFLFEDSLRERYALLVPDVLIDLTVEILRLARQNPRGLGTLEESRLVIGGGYKFPMLEALDPFEQQVLLEGALSLLYQHGAFFRESFETKKLLIFPSLLNQKPPVREPPPLEENTCYRITGNVEHIYAALVVLLNYTSLFTRTYHWDNRTQFEMGLGEVCGFRQNILDEQEIELVLYYGKGTQTFTRSIFSGLFEKFLYGHNVQVRKYPAIICPNCGQRQDRQMVINLMNASRDHLFCPACGRLLDLRNPNTPSAAEASSGPNSPTPLAPAERTKTQMHFQETMDKIREFFQRNHRQPTRCFISYAWGNELHEQWVARLANHLRSAGIDATLDRWDNPNIGKSAEPFLRSINSSEFILVVGTPLYRQKYETRLASTGSMVHDEIELINQRLLGTEAQKSTVLPLLLEGDEKQSFPTPLHGRIYSDFQQERFYFVNLFNLVLILYHISPQDPILGELRKFIQKGSSSSYEPQQR